MTRRQYVTIGGIALAVVLAVLLLVGVRNKEALQRMRPAWLDPGQPPDDISSALMVCTEAESWAANRCRPMVASCGPNSAGHRIRRTYPATLAASEGSFVRARADVELAGGM